MTKITFNSEADFVRTVAESKRQYDAKRSAQSFEEKLAILVKLQEKVALVYRRRRGSSRETFQVSETWKVSH